MSSLASQINGGHVSVSKLIEIVNQIKGGQTLGAYKITTLQDTLNQLIPGLAPLLLLFLVLWLLRKRVSAITIIFGLFAVGILAYWLGIMG